MLKKIEEEIRLKKIYMFLHTDGFTYILYFRVGRTETDGSFRSLRLSLTLTIDFISSRTGMTTDDVVCRVAGRKNDGRDRARTTLGPRRVILARERGRDKYIQVQSIVRRTKRARV